MASSKLTPRISYGPSAAAMAQRLKRLKRRMVVQGVATVPISLAGLGLSFYQAESGLGLGAGVLTLGILAAVNAVGLWHYIGVENEVAGLKAELNGLELDSASPSNPPDSTVALRGIPM